MCFPRPLRTRNRHGRSGSDADPTLNDGQPCRTQSSVPTHAVPLMNIHVTETTNRKLHTHYDTTPPVQNTATENLSGLLLLLIYLHPKGEGTHALAFSGFNNAWSWRFSAGLVFFRRTQQTRRTTMVHNFPGNRPDEKRCEMEGCATSRAWLRKRASCCQCTSSHCDSAAITSGNHALIATRKVQLPA